MSRIDDLIRDLCSDGVEYRTIGSLGQWRGGGTPSKSRPEFWENGTIPWVSPKDMGSYELASTQDKITLQATRESSANLVPGPSLAVVSRSSILQHTLPVSIVPFEASFNQDTKTLTPHKNVNLHYAAHVLRAHANSILATTTKRGGSVNSLILPKFLEYKVPIPPLPIQEEIVRTLSNFEHLATRLEMELKAELEARQNQFTYYRDHLVTGLQQVQLVPIKDIGELQRGRRFTRNDMVDEGIPAIHYGEIYTTYGYRTESTTSFVKDEIGPQLRFAQPGDVIIAAVGETVADVGTGVAWLGTTPVAYHDDSFALHHNQDSRYISHALRTSEYRRQKDRFVSRAKVKRLSARGIEQIRIPLPALNEQRRIADILDEFDALVNDLTSGLPAEIKARRTQYEYYRDRLFTFPEKK